MVGPLCAPGKGTKARGGEEGISAGRVFANGNPKYHKEGVSDAMFRHVEQTCKCASPGRRGSRVRRKNILGISSLGKSFVWWQNSVACGDVLP